MKVNKLDSKLDIEAVKHVKVNGLSIAYREAGQGRPLLCVHGNFASGRWFTEVEVPGWRLLALDLPNFGASEPLPEPISIGAYADSLHGFIEVLELAPLVLLGHSLGGTVAEVYAAAHPDTLRGLVLVSAAPPAGLKTAEEHYALLDSLQGNAEMMAQSLAPTTPTRQPEYFGDLVQDALKMAPAAFTENARALEHYDVTKELANVTCPVLVIRCAQDYLITDEMAETTAHAFSNAQLIRHDSVGHSPQVEDPVWFNARLAEFLEGLL
jgi:branched-chain amino acid transport system permease protein